MPRVGGCFKMTSNDSTKLGSFFENPALKKIKSFPLTQVLVHRLGMRKAPRTANASTDTKQKRRR